MVRRIAITQREIVTSDYPDPRDALSQDWALFFDEVFPGTALVPVPNCTPDIAGWLAAVAPDLVVFSGGNDWGSVPRRDQLEAELLTLVQTSGVPVLFTCRGFQVLLALFGTRLTTDLTGQTVEQHVAQAHEIVLSGNTFIQHANELQRIKVNSFHNQGAMVSDLKVGGELIAFASTDHGVLEGCVHTSLPFLGVQWHPERPESNRNFDSAIITELAYKGAFWS